MPEEIRKRLEELHDHLDDVDGDDAADLQAAVRRYQDSLGDEADDEPDFIEGLRDAALRYEVSHPELSNFLARLVNSLTAAGF